MTTTLISDNSITVPPYGGIVELAATTARGAFPRYFVIHDCFSSSGGGIHWDIYQLNSSNAQVAHDEANTGTSCGQEWAYIHDFASTATHVSIAYNTSSSFSDSKARFRLYYTDDPGIEPGNTIVGGSTVLLQALIAAQADCCAQLLAAVRRTY